MNSLVPVGIMEKRTTVHALRPLVLIACLCAGLIISVGPMQTEAGTGRQSKYKASF